MNFKSSPLLERVEALLAKADVQINGPRAWDLKIHDVSGFTKSLARGSLGLGEAYMDGLWDADCLDDFFHRVLRAHLDREVSAWPSWLWEACLRFTNRQSPRRAWQVGEAHYDLGNNFYEAMLGPARVYSCAYWKDATSLDTAQTAKLDMICQKLRLKPGMKVLDLGCGWGALMAHASRYYGVACHGITISKNQASYITNHFPDLPIRVTLEDYRTLRGSYDAIASIGMFEHVGCKNHRTFLQIVHECLADGGLFLLHTIGKNERTGHTDPWIEKYIFPNGELPSLAHIADASDGLFVTEDFHNFGADYDKTLMAWFHNFQAAWPKFAESMGIRFFRQWKYYLLSCAGAFRARDMQLWQWVFSKTGLPGGYQRVI
jgi:cyclopropane-fatty-acyl-phospholipid synthase